MTVYNGKWGKKPNGYDDSVTKEFLAMMDEMIMAPDTVIRKDWMKTAVAIIKRYRNKGINDTSETVIEGQRNEIAYLQAKLSLLTAALNDNERAERVALTHPIIQSLRESNAMEIIREEAITDYRTMLKEETV